MTTVLANAPLSNRFAAAVDYARVQHASQFRKGSNIPYLYHLLAVSSLVLEYGGDEDQAIAGLLHDVLEDCGADQESVIRERFGDHVASIVKACTDGTAESKARIDDPDARRRDWWERKLVYVAHLRHEPAHAVLVSGCDKLHNARAIVGDLENPEVGVKVFDRFTGGIDGTLRYYHSLSQIFATRRAPMARALTATIERMHQLAGVDDPATLDHGIYRLKVYDNYHHMDEEETYGTGLFFSADEALAAARRCVDESLASCRDSVETDAEVLDQYKAFGDDPVVLGHPAIQFSAWSYAASKYS